MPASVCLSLPNFNSLERRTEQFHKRLMPFAVGPGGSFQFSGVPAEEVTFYLRIPGYQLTPRDAFLMAGSSTNFTVTGDIEGMVIRMEPRSEPRP